MPAPFEKLKYICTGSPHSGTGYVARLLTSFGIICGHEHIFHQQFVRNDWNGHGPWGNSWEKVQGDSSWPAHRCLDHEFLDGAHLIHVVRNPLHVVESLWMKRGGGAGTLRRLCNCLAIYREVTENVLFARKIYPGRFSGYSTYRVESGPEGMSKLLGIQVPDDVFDERDYNSHMHGTPRQLTSWDVVHDMVIGDLSWFREASNRFGYGVC